MSGIFQKEEVALDCSFTYIKKLLFESEDLLARALACTEISQAALAFGKKYSQEIIAGFSPPVECRYVSEKVGHGLFTKTALDEEAFIGEYVGLVREPSCLHPPNNYLWTYPVKDHLDRSLDINAEPYGNHTRFINHSFSPNLKPLFAHVGGIFHVILIAIRPIKAEEQLSYDYGKNYWYIRGKPADL